MLNRAILMGRLVASPELRQTPNGISVCSFSVAVDRNRSSGGERQTDFLDVVAWRKTAEFVNQYFHKGNMIIVEGSIQTRNWEDKNGNKRKAVEVVAENVQFGERKNSAQGNETPPATTQPAQSADVGDYSEMSGDSDDLPF